MPRPMKQRVTVTAADWLRSIIRASRPDWMGICHCDALIFSQIRKHVGSRPGTGTYILPFATFSTSLSSPLYILQPIMSHVHSIPTPPFSPNDQQLPSPDAEYPLKSTMNLLDSLVAFYQHERMWVYRTRAVLEEAFEHPPAINSSNPDADTPIENSFPSPPDSSSSSPSSSTTASSGEHKSSRAGQPATRWMRRKTGFKLKLEGISKPRRLSSKLLGKNKHDQEAKERILQLFEKMMEDRMESCQRVTKLVRNAHRPYLNSR